MKNEECNHMQVGCIWLHSSGDLDYARLDDLHLAPGATKQLTDATAGPTVQNGCKSKSVKTDYSPFLTQAMSGRIISRRDAGRG